MDQLRKPAALIRKRLSGRVGAGLDPCGAILLAFDLAKGKSCDIVFTLGAGLNKQEADALAERYHGISAADEALTVSPPILAKHDWNDKGQYTRSRGESFSKWLVITSSLIKQIMGT